MDSHGYHWHVGSELNTGIAFFRNSAGARAVLEEWAQRMKDAIAKVDTVRTRVGRVEVPPYATEERVRVFSMRGRGEPGFFPWSK